MTCSDCVYYQPETEARGVTTGECRRYPPQIVQTVDVAEVIQEFSHPMVRNDHWCGEFYERDDEWRSQDPN